MNRQMTDREAYPAVWIVLLGLGIGFLVWKYLLGAPTISACWFYRNWHIYCPGCGGTRAVIALARGEVFQSLYDNPAVPVTAVWGMAYIASQTVWRLRKKRGWALHYDRRWPLILFGLLLVNCIVRNLLWLGFGLAI